MEPEIETPPAPSRRRNVIASFRTLGVTLLILAAVWVMMRYVLTPLVFSGNTAVIEDTGMLEQRIAQIESKVTALENKPEPATIDLAPLESRIAALEGAPKAEAPPAAVPTIDHAEIDTLKAEIESLKANSQATVRSVLLITQLQDAIRTGRPYASEMTALIALHPEMEKTLAPIGPYRATGVATLAALNEQFARTIDPALHPETADKSLVANLQSLVKIRKVGASQKGNDDESIIARAEAALTKGEVAAAVSEISTLSPIGAKNFAGWKERAEANLAAQSVAATLAQELAK